MKTEKGHLLFVKAGEFEKILISGVNHLDKKIDTLDALVKESLQNNREKNKKTLVWYSFGLLAFFNLVQIIINHLVIN